MGVTTPFSLASSVKKSAIEAVRVCWEFVTMHRSVFSKGLYRKEVRSRTLQL